MIVLLSQSGCMSAKQTATEIVGTAVKMHEIFLLNDVIYKCLVVYDKCGFEIWYMMKCL